jgi:hypothetical protein
MLPPTRPQKKNPHGHDARPHTPRRPAGAPP